MTEVVEKYARQSLDSWRQLGIEFDTKLKNMPERLKEPIKKLDELLIALESDIEVKERKICPYGLLGNLFEVEATYKQNPTINLSFGLNWFGGRYVLDATLWFHKKTFPHDARRKALEALKEQGVQLENYSFSGTNSPKYRGVRIHLGHTEEINPSRCADLLEQYIEKTLEYVQK